MPFKPVQRHGKGAPYLFKQRRGIAPASRKGQRMTRKVVTKIELEFDLDQLQTDPEITMTDDELQMAAAEMFCEDIYNLVKYNELYDVAVARTRIVDAANDQSPENII